MTQCGTYVVFGVLCDLPQSISPASLIRSQRYEHRWNRVIDAIPTSRRSFGSDEEVGFFTFCEISQRVLVLSLRGLRHRVRLVKTQLLVYGTCILHVPLSVNLHLSATNGRDVTTATREQTRCVTSQCDDRCARTRFGSIALTLYLSVTTAVL